MAWGMVALALLGSPILAEQQNTMDKPEMRQLVKIGAGSAGCVVVTTLAVIVQQSGREPGEYSDPWSGYHMLLLGLAAGSAVGFPLGVTLVDPMMQPITP